MLEPLGEVTLKSGERVSASAVRGPDEAWRARITRLLGHKGDIWRWQNTELLARDTGIDAWFYVLHRDGEPFAHILTAELNGVGIFGHVWTEPADRGLGASGGLIVRQLAHFRARGGRALFLHTDPGGHAFALYQRHGFAAIEPGNGAMLLAAPDRAAFAADWFAPGDAKIEPLGWRHWPTAPALFTADIPGVVRCAPLGVYGRKSTEETLLPWIQDAPAGHAFAAVKSNGAVVGLAAWGRDPLSADCVSVDVFCHPRFWQQAPPLLTAVLARAPRGRRIAYADSDCPAKLDALAGAGFRPVANWPGRLAVDTAATRRADLLMLEQGGLIA